jgi:phospholipase D1/2
MMTPYFQLERPCELADRESRLDYILESIALQGVKIYIILYMEPKIALNNDSLFVENYFHEMNKNIKVLRHPNFILIPFLWSHHEKIIIIDQKMAFLGGLDLCYGRWDTQKHKIVEF